MVIDKTTGRGCALSMASKAVTGKLIGDGIIGKAIYRRRRINSKNCYELLRVTKFRHDKAVYVISEKGKGSTEELLWTPSFIDEEIWAQAVRRFPKFEQLDKSVEKHLLPKMDEYLQSISDPELISMTKDLLGKHGIINTPIRQYAGKTYYFSENEIYSLDKESQLFPYEGRSKYKYFQDHDRPLL